MGMRGRESTTARVAVGRACGSPTWTDCVPPGPRTMGPEGGAPGRPAVLGGGGGAGRAATFCTPTGTLLPGRRCTVAMEGAARGAGGGSGGATAAAATGAGALAAGARRGLGGAIGAGATCAAAAGAGGGGGAASTRASAATFGGGDDRSRTDELRRGKRLGRRRRGHDLDRRRGGWRRRRRHLVMVADRLAIRTEGVGLLAPEHDAAGGRLGSSRLRHPLPRHALHHGLGLVVLERGGVALHVVFVGTEPVHHLLVGEAQVLRELIDALLRHPSPSTQFAP